MKHLKAGKASCRLGKNASKGQTKGRNVSTFGITQVKISQIIKPGIESTENVGFNSNESAVVVENYPNINI